VELAAISYRASMAKTGQRGRGNGAKASTWADLFSHFAQAAALATGHPAAFLAAAVVVVMWLVTGPIFGYSDTWQLVINTGTTIVTFLMVFLIQNTQNRDIMTVQLKLSELVLAMKGAEDEFATLEDLSDEELQALHDRCRARAEMTLQHIHTRGEPGKRAAAQRSAGTSRKSRRNRTS
jgi:low affinity Fe/Cu permease